MRVLAVQPSADLYGSDRMFLAALDGLRADGTEVTAVLPHDGPLAAALASCGVEVVVRPFPVLRRVPRRAAGAVGVLWEWCAGLPRCARLIRQHRPDVVYVSTVVTPMWLVAAAVLRRRVVVHVHEHDANMSRWAARVLLSPLHLATTVVANSPSTLGWLTATSPRLARRTVLVRNGVEGPPTPLEHAAPAPGSPTRLVVIGRLAERKGQDVAILAAAQLGARGYAVELTLVGSSFPGKEGFAERLAELAEERCHQVTVRFAGLAPDPWDTLDNADIAIVPSVRAESFGNVAVEALLAGVPTVAADVPGLHDLLRHGETGLLVPPGDPERLADAVAELIDDPELARMLAEQGQREARKSFGVAHYRREMTRVVVAASGP